MNNQVTTPLMAGNAAWMDRQHAAAKREDRRRILERALPCVKRLIALKTEEIRLLRTLRDRLVEESKTLK